MAKVELKTKASEVSVADYLAAIPEAARREDAAAIDALYRKVTGLEPKMWGPSIIGYGSYTYRYDSGREGTMCRAGFAPRKGNHVFYGLLEQAGEAQLARLGKYTTGKGCLYVRKLGDVDLAVLEDLVSLSWASINARYPA
ncbi:DUF1801 domain-containing protein [Novosphingobium aquiterrae]|uniref:DUF1801 domain-containing protein n=1 Tax=Novosphingobium aquiterrae TaxID=624388 RepID=A0ABV6PE36_9SPHN